MNDLRQILSEQIDDWEASGLIGLENALKISDLVEREVHPEIEAMEKENRRLLLRNTGVSTALADMIEILERLSDTLIPGDADRVRIAKNVLRGPR